MVLLKAVMLKIEAKTQCNTLGDGDTEKPVNTLAVLRAECRDKILF